MALTAEAVSQLGARIVEHDGLGPGIRLANGALKTGHGIVIPPSSEPAGTKSGRLDGEEGSETTQVEAPVVPQAEPAAARRGRRKVVAKEKPTESLAAAPAAVRVEVEVAGFGRIPTQYAHVYPGTGMLVLGLTELSFVPAVADTSDMRLVGFSVAPGRKYAYCGNRFTDRDGITNIVMIEIGEKQNG